MHFWLYEFLPHSKRSDIHLCSSQSIRYPFFECLFVYNFNKNTCRKCFLIIFISSQFFVAFSNISYDLVDAAFIVFGFSNGSGMSFLDDKSAPGIYVCRRKYLQPSACASSNLAASFGILAEDGGEQCPGEAPPRD